MGFRFQSPYWLILMVPLLAIAWLSIRKTRRDAVVYSSIALLQGLPITPAQRIKRLLPWLRVLGLGLVVLALSRPQRGLEEFRIRTEGVAIQMCLDRSGSMQAMDFTIDNQRVNRLAAVKKVFRDFVAGGGQLDGRPDDQIGLIPFGGFAESRAPLTLDHGVLLQVLDTVEIPKPIRDSRGRVINAEYLEEESATAIGDAIVLACDRLKDVEAKSKVIILLSDGENTAGAIQPAEAAQLAKSLGIKIYAIGVGSTGRAPFPAVDAFGREALVAQVVRLDEETLKMLADTTGGSYFNAKTTDALEQVYAQIDQLEKSVTEGRLYTQYHELFQSFVFPGLSLVLLEIVLSATRFRSLP